LLSLPAIFENMRQKKDTQRLSRTGKSAVHNILAKAQIKPHETTYYLEKRDEHFEEKMAQVLFVYKEVQQVNNGEERERKTTISYDYEKPGIQAIGNVAPDLAPQYLGNLQHGTLSLLAGIDLHNGHILGLVRERHRSREFIEFLNLADTYYLKTGRSGPFWTIIRLMYRKKLCGG